MWMYVEGDITELKKNRDYLKSRALPERAFLEDPYGLAKYRAPHLPQAADNHRRQYAYLLLACYHVSRKSPPWSCVMWDGYLYLFEYHCSLLVPI